MLSYIDGAGEVVGSSYCLCKGPEFSSQQTHNGSQTGVCHSSLGDPGPSSGLCSHDTHMEYLHKSRENIQVK